MFTKICEIRLDMYIFTIFGTTLVVLKKNLSLIKSHVKVPTYFLFSGPTIFKILRRVLSCLKYYIMFLFQMKTIWRTGWMIICRIELHFSRGLETRQIQFTLETEKKNVYTWQSWFIYNIIYLNAESHKILLNVYEIELYYIFH